MGQHELAEESVGSNQASATRNYSSCNRFPNTLPPSELTVGRRKMRSATGYSPIDRLVAL
jgi:hypothetical protein